MITEKIPNSRLKNNLAIVSKLSKFLKENPNFKFIEALCALNLLDESGLDRLEEESVLTNFVLSESALRFSELKSIRDKREKYTNLQ